MDQLPNISGSNAGSRDKLRDPDSGHHRPIHRTAIAIKELGLKLTETDEHTVLTPSSRGTIIKPSEVKISLKTGEKRLDEFTDLAKEVCCSLIYFDNFRVHRLPLDKDNLVLFTVGLVEILKLLSNLSTVLQHLRKRRY
jgi:hypothetical protein